MSTRLHTRRDSLVYDVDSLQRDATALRLVLFFLLGVSQPSTPPEFTPLGNGAEKNLVGVHVNGNRMVRFRHLDFDLPSASVFYVW